MFCRYCGKEIEDDSVFCRYCGRELKKDQNLGNDEAPVSRPKKMSLKTIIKYIMEHKNLRETLDNTTIFCIILFG